MPKQVDHDERRREVTEVAAHLVATQGRRALTARRVAAATGHSTTVVSHYFADMDDLLYETYSLAVVRSRGRVAAVLDRDPLDVVGLAEALLPLDEVRNADWRIWLAFWGEALSSPELAAEQRRRARNSSDRFHRCLDGLAAAGRLAATVDTRSAADRIAALILGIAGEAVFDPEKWPPDVQRETIRSAIRGVGVHLDRRDLDRHLDRDLDRDDDPERQSDIPTRADEPSARHTRTGTDA